VCMLCFLREPKKVAETLSKHMFLVDLEIREVLIQVQDVVKHVTFMAK